MILETPIIEWKKRYIEMKVLTDKGYIIILRKGLWQNGKITNWVSVHLKYKMDGEIYCNRIGTSKTTEDGLIKAVETIKSWGI